MTSYITIRRLLGIILVSLACNMLTQAESETEQEKEFRIITKDDIKKLPKELTIAQLFKLWYPVHLPDPPLFIYPSSVKGHCYFVAAHPDDSGELARENYKKVRVRSIFLFKYTMPTKLSKKPAWGKAPLIEPVIRDTLGPFNKSSNAEQGSAHQPTTAK